MSSKEFSEWMIFEEWRREEEDKELKKLRKETELEGKRIPRMPRKFH